MSKWDDAMARLDAVVAAAAQVKTSAADELADQVLARVATLEADLGITAPAVQDPTVTPVDPSVPSNVAVA